jgi:hypothetical protein
MPSRADVLLARLAAAKAKREAAWDALMAATDARSQANVAVVEADRELEAARAAIEREASGL